VPRSKWRHARCPPRICAFSRCRIASPAKWHLAHTSWFFETFVLADTALGDYQPFNSGFNYLFNSYYDAVGDRHPRAQRGLLTRPSADEVFRYRAHVDNAMAERLLKIRNADYVRLRSVIELGINHEQQHLELLFTDIKHAFAQNPLKPALSPVYSARSARGKRHADAYTRQIRCQRVSHWSRRRRLCVRQ